MVAVVAHPDDESLIAGGTLALAATASVETGVVSLTRGEYGALGVPLREGESLGSVRERELRSAAGTLGCRWTACLRHPDSGLVHSDQSAVARELAELLATHRTTSVLTFGQDGLYGHPDHIAVRAIAGVAVDLLEEGGDAPVWLYEAVWDPGLVARTVAAAHERGLPTDMWGLEPEAFGSSTEGAAVVVDVRSVLDRKLAALRSHRTQLAPGHLLAALPDDLAQLFLGEESWRVARPLGAGDGPLGSLAASGRDGGADGSR